MMVLWLYRYNRCDVYTATSDFHCPVCLFERLFWWFKCFRFTDTNSTH